MKQLAFFLTICSLPALCEVKVRVLNTVSIDRCHHYGYFPALHMLSTGELIATFSLDPDAANVESPFWGFVVSRDKGRTWGLRNTAGMVYRVAAYTRVPRPDGSVFMLAGYPIASEGKDYTTLRGVSVRIFNHGDSIELSRDIRLRLPKPSYRQPLNEKVEGSGSMGPGKIKETGYVFFNGDILGSRSGGLLVSMYGRFEGDRHDRSMIATSDREGKTWTYLSTIAGPEMAVVLAGEKDTEGFNEPRLVRLTDGRLFAVTRRGSNNLMYKAWSSDDGKTWTRPVSIGFRGVLPALWLMKNGVLALCSGRPDPVTMRFSTDNGQTWTNPTVLFQEKGTRYTDLVEVEPNKLLVVYDHVPFDWGAIPDSAPDAMNTVYGTFVAVTR